MTQQSYTATRRRHTFILGLWQEGGAAPGASPVWRYSLENPRTAERCGFGDARDLLAMLEQWMALPAHQEPKLHKPHEDPTP
jgi:hypothetical protein